MEASDQLQAPDDLSIHDLSYNFIQHKIKEFLGAMIDVQ